METFCTPDRTRTCKPLPCKRRMLRYYTTGVFFERNVGFEPHFLIGNQILYQLSYISHFVDNENFESSLLVQLHHSVRLYYVVFSVLTFDTNCPNLLGRWDLNPHDLRPKRSEISLIPLLPKIKDF